MRRFYVPWHLAISFIPVIGEQPCLLLPPLHFPWVGRKGKPETDFSLHLELGELQVSRKRLSKFIASHTLLPAFGLRMLSSRGLGLEPGVFAPVVVFTCF